MSDYSCPNCGKDLENYCDNLENFSYYGGSRFNCPDCGVLLESQYDEMWDGQEEFNFYSLKVIEE